MGDDKIGLALSGGGVRAAAFHAGILKWLAERGELERISYISSVSGGSLFVGLVFNCNEYQWPSSEKYLTKVLSSIRSILTETSLQKTALNNLLLKPWNWKFILSKANIISKTIESLWGIDARLRDLPRSPIWALNGTTGENGRRFRIKGTGFGDYKIGYTDIANFKLADAMAISAAFPVGIGPLTFNTSEYKWEKQKSWDSEELMEKYSPVFNKLHLYDGGVYDNLGIEPLFDIGKQKVKKQDNLVINKILVSDASSPLLNRTIHHSINPFRIKRLIDIMLDQVRALRVRSLVNFLQVNSGSGAYYQLGSIPTEAIKKYGDLSIKKIIDLLENQWLNSKEIQKISRYPTTLNQMVLSDFDLLVQHGYETAKWNDCIWEKVCGQEQIFKT